MSTAKSRLWLFDTNIYVAALREGLGGPTFDRLTESAPRTYLAAVVSAELYAGARDRAGRRAVVKLSKRFARMGRIVVPTAASWDAAGEVMARIAREDPGVRSQVRALWNDALIAFCARQVGATVVTADTHDYTLLRKHVRFGLEVTTGARN
jgi:predicted nucleic acid-binding protein